VQQNRLSIVISDIGKLDNIRIDMIAIDSHVGQEAFDLSRRG
jgi:hypothetical protein